MAHNNYIGHTKEETAKRLQDLLINSLVVNGTLLSSDVTGGLLYQMCTGGNNPAKDLDPNTPSKFTRDRIDCFNSIAKQLLDVDGVTEEFLEYAGHLCDVSELRLEQFKSELIAFNKILRVLEELWDTEIVEIFVDSSGVFLIVQTSNLQQSKVETCNEVPEEEFEDAEDEDDSSDTSEYF